MPEYGEAENRCILLSLDDPRLCWFRFDRQPEAERPLSIRHLWLRLAASLLLLAINAFFVAAEFSIVAARRARVDEMAASGNRGARQLQRVLGRLDRYIAVLQLTVTVTCLALGWLGGEAVADLADVVVVRLGYVTPSLAAHNSIAVIVAFVVVAAFTMIIGELAPKGAALGTPERVATMAAGPLVLLATIFGPVLLAFEVAAHALLRIFGVRPRHDAERVHSPDELRLMVMQSRAHGALDETDSAMLAGVFDFHVKRARDVMRPRTEVVALPLDASEEEVWRTMRAERYSRYPVYGESLDDVVGVLVAKDLWLRADHTALRLAQLIREPLYVPDTRPAERVLDDLRRSRAHMAVVLDEYGGTAGIITLEDLVEEVIGDINDEYDVAIRTAVEANGVLELAGSLSLVDVRTDYHLPIPDGDWTTLGGYAFARIGRLPRIGDKAKYPGGELEVVAMEGRRVAAVRVIRADKAVAQKQPVIENHRATHG